tara:strand:+ start:449 stop:1420 length:972 start_codon:yes stop_codon:yes gene_type:complete
LKRAIITGVTGQDGSYLAELLLSKGYNVLGLKRRTSIIATERIDHLMDHTSFKLEYWSLFDAGAFYRILQEFKPDEVYNLAAQSHVRVSFDVPEETALNVGIGFLRILEAVRHINPAIRVYQASSSEMFGDNPSVPQTEATRLSPASPYACAKVFSHHLCRNYREAYGMHVSSGILFNHESPRRGETFVTRKITRAVARIKLGLQDKLYLGNLQAKRDWGFAGDYVEAMWLMLQQPQADDYVIATGASHSVRDFLRKVFDIAGLKVEDHIEFDSRLLRPHEVPFLLGDSSKARDVLGWESKTSLDKLAKMMYESDLAEERKKI